MLLDKCTDQQRWNQTISHCVLKRMSIYICIFFLNPHFYACIIAHNFSATCASACSCKFEHTVCNHAAPCSGFLFLIVPRWEEETKKNVEQICALRWGVKCWAFHLKKKVQMIRLWVWECVSSQLTIISSRSRQINHSISSWCRALLEQLCSSLSVCLPLSKEVSRCQILRQRQGGNLI